MQRFSNFIPETSPLLSSNTENPSDDVLIDITAENTVNVSKPRNPKNLTSRKYNEIQTALTILENAKKNFISYRTMEAKRRNFVGVYNILCLLLTPGIPFVIMLKLHTNLAALIARKIATLTPLYEQAREEKEKFMGWYHGQIDRFDKDIELYKDPLGQHYSHPCFDQLDQYYPDFGRREHEFFEGPCGNSYTEMDTSHYDWRIPDFCASNATLYSNAECSELVDYLCNMENELLGCMDEYSSHYPEHQKLKDDFLSEQQARVNQIRTNYDKFANDINGWREKDSWEPISTNFFSITVVICMTLAIYLGTSWRYAVKEYEQDLTGLHALDECLNPEDFPLIINLANKFKISLKDIHLETLIKKLEVIKMKLESSITFFHIAQRAYLPYEVTQRLLEEANMLIPMQRHR